MRAHAVLGLLVLTAAATAAQAAVPDWAKPYVDRPVPRGAFVGDSEWVALRSEIEIEVRPLGIRRRVYRQVLAPTGGTPRSLRIGLGYDGAKQRLEPPQLWVRHGWRTRQVDLSKASVEVPNWLAEGTGGERMMLASTEALEPADRAILVWEVVDREPLLDEEVLWPFALYPAAELVIRAAAAPSGGAAPQLLLVEPREGSAPSLRDGEVTLRDVPSFAAIYGQDPWLASPLEALPHVVLRAGPPGGAEWPSLAARAGAFFRDALAADPRNVWVPTAVHLAAGAEPGLEKAARMDTFVQSLPYRDIAWGLAAHRPAPPGATLRSLSADCKGKVLLLQALLSEAGIESTPVLGHAGPGYQGEPAVPSLLVFDHAVLAVHLAGAEAWPGALTEGPGQGWLLFDPTDPLATLGLPPSNLEGGYGLWLGPPGSGLFPIHTRQPGCRRVDASLAAELTPAGEARWKLTATGDSPLSQALLALHLNQGDAERFRQTLQELVRASVPGAVLGTVRFDPPDHRARRPARLEIDGTIPHPLQSVGGALSTFPSPTALVGQALGIPALGARRDSSAPKETREPLPGRAEPRFQDEPYCLHGDISLALPAGWTVTARPALRPVASPWLAVRTADDPGWSVTVEIPRGRFAAGSEKPRLADLSSLTALFRQPFLLRAPDGPSK